MQWMFRQTIQHKMQDNAEQDCDTCLPVSAVYACLSVFCYLQTCHSCITTPVWTVWRQQWHEVPVIWRWYAHRRKASVCGAAGGIVSQVWWTWTSVFSYSRVQSHHWPECQWWQLHSWYVCVCDWSVSFRHSVSYSWNVVGRRHVPRRSVDQHSVSAAHDNEEAPPPKLECSVAWILQWSIGSLSCRTQICSISATSSKKLCCPFLWWFLLLLQLTGVVHQQFHAVDCRFNVLTLPLTTASSNSLHGGSFSTYFHTPLSRCFPESVQAAWLTVQLQHHYKFQIWYDDISRLLSEDAAQFLFLVIQRLQLL